MKYQKLGTTNEEVSVICLGTMNWGEQNTQKEAHEQMDYAVAHDVNFFDTAELYPIPPNAKSSGLTEKYIGSWFKKSAKRDDIFLASKVVGPSDLVYMRDGRSPRLDKADIKKAIEGSLKRLQTDHVDLYQIHWPDRQTNFFGTRAYVHKDEALNLETILETMQELITEGKVRYVGLSNETAWGTMEYLRLHRDKDLPRVMSIQNPYSLLMREYENALAEVSMREHVSLLVYSPLSGGVLSGKYLGGVMPKGSRFDYSKRNNARYNPEHAQPAIQAYVDIATKHGLDPAQMALAFINSREFVTSNIIGATTIQQLQVDIASIDLDLSAEVIKEIEAVHFRMPNPIT